MGGKGAALCDFSRLLPTNLNVPLVTNLADHKVYVKLPLSDSPGDSKIPEPYPNIYTDIWSNKHVRMPNSPQAFCPVNLDGENKVVLKWLAIQQAFQYKIENVADFQKAILFYNKIYDGKWKFDGLKYLIEDEYCEEEREYFFDNILAKIIDLALHLPSIITKPPVFLSRKNSQSITLSQKQIACLLANAFLCTFPGRNTRKFKSDYGTYPDINFNRLFAHKEPRSLEKLKCIIYYFKRVITKEPDGLVTFSRQHVSEDCLPDFHTSLLPLTRLHIASEGLIEEAEGMLQVDFANKFLGGGVLGLGCVQEEIRFVLCPELIISRLFTEALDKHEAVIVTGAEQYSSCRGYASSFEWGGPFYDSTRRDPYRRRLCQVVAIDALRFAGEPEEQFDPQRVIRELNKAYVGFRPLDGSGGETVAVATGNWGCGAFKGDPRLKGLIQFAAASVAKRDVLYLTFGDEALRDDLLDIHNLLTQQKISVGQLVMCLCQYGSWRRAERIGGLLDYVRRTFSHYESDTEMEIEDYSQPDSLIDNSQPQSSSAPTAQPSTTQAAATSKNRSCERKITDYFKMQTKVDCAASDGSYTKSALVGHRIAAALDECDNLVKKYNVTEEKKMNKANMPETAVAQEKDKEFLFKCLDQIDDRV